MTDATTQILAVTLLVAASGCFSEPGTAGSASESDTTGTTSTQATQSADNESSTSTNGSESSTAADETSSATSPGSTSSSSDESSSSTGGVAACSCPTDAWLCESFEDFDRPPVPWGYNTSAGASPPMAVPSVSAPCGAAQLEAEVQDAELFSVAVAAVEANSSLVTVHALVYVEGGCLPAAGSQPVRTVEFQLIEDGPLTRAAAGVWLDQEGGSLILLLMGGGSLELDFEMADLGDVWHEFVIDMVFNAGDPPEVTLFIDDEEVASGAGNLVLPASVDAYSANLTVGPYLADLPFPSSCLEAFDDVWIAPTP